MNRRELIKKTACGILAGRLIGSPIFLSAQSKIPWRLLMIFLRGGGDTPFCPFSIVKPSLLHSLKQIRPSLILYPRNELPRELLSTAAAFYPWENAYKLGDNDVGLHPIFADHFRNLSESNSRISSIKVKLPNGNEVPLGSLMTFKIITNVGVLHELSRSHAEAQAHQFYAARRPGFLARLIHLLDGNSELLKLAFSAGTSAFELGAVGNLAALNLRDVAGTYAQQLGEGVYSSRFFPYCGCADYRQTDLRLRAINRAWDVSNLDHTVKVSAKLMKTRSALGGNLVDEVYRMYTSVEKQMELAERFNNFTLHERTFDNQTLAQRQAAERNFVSRFFAPRMYVRPGEIILGPVNEQAILISKFLLLDDVPSLPENETRVAVCSVGGYDTHNSEIEDMHRRVTELAGIIQGVIASFAVRNPSLLSRLVILFVTDFGRWPRESSNSSSGPSVSPVAGTEHGHGYNTAVIFGKWPPDPTFSSDAVLGPSLEYNPNAGEPDTIWRSNIASDLTRFIPKINIHNLIVSIFGRYQGYSTIPDSVLPRDLQLVNFAVPDGRIDTLPGLFDGV